MDPRHPRQNPYPRHPRQNFIDPRKFLTHTTHAPTPPAPPAPPTPTTSPRKPRNFADSKNQDSFAKKLDGGGRKTKDMDLEEMHLEWITYKA